MTYYFPKMTEAKPVRFSLDGEIERLRMEIRDRDFIIIRQEAQIAAMRNCENCKHFYGDFSDIGCNIDAPCGLPSYEAWERKE